MPEEELYDLESDPHEIRNLAASTEHAPILQRLRQALEKWILETDDQGRIPEPEELIKNKGVTKSTTHPQTGYSIEPRPPVSPARPAAPPSK